MPGKTAQQFLEMENIKEGVIVSIEGGKSAEKLRKQLEKLTSNSGYRT